MGAPGLKLQCERTPGELDTYHLKPDRRYHIGRGSTCEIRILDMKMSRQHCAIEYQEGLWMLLDLGSTNGLLVDGLPLADRRPLMEGCELLVGNTLLLVAGIDEAANEAASEFFCKQRREQRQSDDPHTDSDPFRSDSDLLPDTGTVRRTGALVSSEDASVRVPILPPPRPLDSGQHEIPDLAPAAEGATPLEVRRDDVDRQATVPDRQATVPDQDDEEFSPSPAPLRAGDDDRQVRTARTVGPVGEEVGDTASAAEVPDAPPGPTGARHTASGRIRPITIRIGVDGQQHDVAPEEDQAPRALDETDDRLLYINVLGRRIGPVNRSRARELKALELKGQLTEQDLVEFDL